MKRKLLIITTAVILTLVAGLALYVESASFERRLRPVVLGPLQEVLGPGVTIGRIRMTLVPLVLEVRDISLAAGPSGGGIALRKIRVYINPFPLLYRTLSLTSVSLLEPRVAASRDTSGDIDLQQVVERIVRNLERSRGAGPGPLRIRIGSITVRNGKVAYVDRPSEARAELSRIDLKISFGDRPDRGTVRIESARCLASWATSTTYEAVLHASGSFDGRAVTVTKLDVSGPAARFSLAGNAVAERGGAIDLKATVSVGRRLAGRIKELLRKDGREQRTALDAAVAVTGTWSDPAAQGAVQIAELPLPGLTVKKTALDFRYRDHAGELSGTDWVLERSGQSLLVRHAWAEAAYRQGTVHITQAVLAADGAVMRANGTINASSDIRVSLSAESSEQGALVTFLTGSVASGAAAVQGALGGTVADPRFEGTLSAGPVNVRGVVFQNASGLLRYQQRTVSIISATIRQDESRYLFNGSVDLRGSEPRYEARLGVIRSDVTSIVALFYKRIPLTMRAAGELTFSGTRTMFTGAGRLDLAEGAAYGETFDRGTVTAELTTASVAFPRVVLEKAGGKVAGKGWIRFDGTYAADIESSGVDLSRVDLMRPMGLSGPFTLAIGSSGSFGRPVVQARAESPSVSVRGIPFGRGTADLALTDGRLDLSLTAENDEGSTVRMQGAVQLGQRYPWNARVSASLRDIDLAPFAGSRDAFTQSHLSAEGILAVQGEGAGPSSLRGSLRLPRVSLVFGEYRIENSEEVRIGIEGGAFSVVSLAFAGTGTRMHITGSADPRGDVELDAQGDLNLSLARLLFREIEHGDGVAQVRLSVRDSWTDPSLEGRIFVRDGMLKVREVPQKLSAMNGTIGFDRERVSSEGIEAEFGGGKLKLSGYAQLRGGEVGEFSLRALLDNVTTRYPPGLTANLGGTLYYDGDPSTQVLSGDIAVLRARYDRRIEWKSMLVDITQGIVQRKKKDMGRVGDTQLNIRLTGRDGIVLENNLGKMPVTVDLQFRGTLKQPQVLGRLESKGGEVYFRKNVFRVAHASADFVTPERIDPVIDVRAETRVREYRIGLSVSGNAERAVYTLLSDPPLSDTDILSMLALGRKGEELKGRESNIGVGEATSFATGKFQDMLESRARNLTGLDRFQVDPYINKSDTAVPRVTVGKEVMQDKLFMTYSSNVGGTTPEQMFRIEYLLNRHLSVVGERNELGNLGADLKFRFEFR